MVLSEDHEYLHGLDRPNSESINTQINEYLYGFERPSSESMNTEINDGLNTSLRLKNQSVNSDSHENGRSKRPRTSSESNSEDTNLIGLTLNKTPSFMNLIESELSQTKRRVGRPPNSSRNRSTTEDFAVASEKLKAANFCATTLTIGTWKRVTKHEGDLIAKCYYAKRKLVWELLDGPLKSKIEIQWSAIIGIKAIMPQGDLPGILEIELNQPPTFYRETNPQPRRLTLWQQTFDFTGGQAPIHRRHCVTFPPGVLDKPYEKLLRCDARLKELSKQPFPSQFYPYFDQPAEYNNEVSDFSFGNAYGSQLYLKMQYPHHLPAASLLLSTDLFPSLHNSAMNVAPLQQFSPSFPVSGESRSNYANINQMSGLWGGQGPNDFVNFPIVNQTIEPLPVNYFVNVPVVNQTIESRSNYANINQMSGLWGGQGPNDFVNVPIVNQTIEPLPVNDFVNVPIVNQTIEPLPVSSTPPQANWAVPNEDNQAMFLQNDSMGNDHNALALNYIKNHLLNDNQVTPYDEPTYTFPGHINNISLGATGDLPDLISSYPTLNNYAVNVANFETAYAHGTANFLDVSSRNK